MTDVQKWNKGPRFKTSITSKEREDIPYELHEDFRAGGPEANNHGTGSM
jgi:hypothetical protein